MGAEGRIKVMVGPHAIYLFSDYLRKRIDLKRELGISIHIHISETEGKVRKVLKNMETTIEYLDVLII